MIGAAEMLRNGITTVQDFLTLVPQDEAIVDTVLSAYEEAGIRVVFAVAARDRAALDIAPFIPADLPEAIRRRIAGSDRKASDELGFIAAQIKRRGLQPTPHADLGARAFGAAALLAASCSKGLRRCRGSMASRFSLTSMRRASRRPRLASSPPRRRCSTCWRAQA